MKKISILCGFLILCASIQAQYYLKTDLFKQHERQDTTMEFPRWEDAQDDSTLIAITTDSLIVINNQDKDYYKLVKLLSTAEGTDLNDGDPWVGVKWLATDNTGMMVMLVVQKFKSKTVLITITYGNLEYRYQCRPYKKPHQQMI
jgi:hypothetical protein